MPGSFAALIPCGVWNMDSPNFALTAFYEVQGRGKAQSQPGTSLMKEVEYPPYVALRSANSFPRRARARRGM
jgi:hypothetical protein